MRQLTEFTEKKITTADGLEIYYEVAGEGKTLVFLHGMGGDVAAWDVVRQAFVEKQYKTIGVDLRAHGYSGRPPTKSGYHMESFARDIDEVISAETRGKVVIVGHCFGGMVAYTYAALYPEKVEALILLTTGYGPPYFSAHSFRKKLIKMVVPFLARVSPAGYRGLHVDYSRKTFEHDFEPIGFLKVLKNNSLKTFFSLTETIMSFHGFHYLSKLTMPILIVAGTKDSIYPLRMSAEMHHELPQSELSVMQGANHPIIINRPREVISTLSSFLQKINYR